MTVNHPVLYHGLKESLGGNATIVNLLVGTRQAIDAQREMDFDQIVYDGLRCLRSHFLTMSCTPRASLSMGIKRVSG